MPGRTPQRRVDLAARLTKQGPRKLLAIDDGGIREVLSLMILAPIEQLLIKESKSRTAGWPTHFNFSVFRP